MKALLNFAFFLLLSTIVNGQVRNLVTDRIYIRDSFRLKDKSIYQISTDATFSSANNKSLASQKAIKDYVQNQIGNIDSLVKAANASGFFTAGHIPYIDATGRMAARGFVEFGAMSAPSTPGAGVRVFADASNLLSWKGVDGYVRSWNGTLTADRLYKLQNKSYTLADSADVAGLSSVYFPLVGGAITGTGGAGFVGLPVQSSAPGTPGSGVRVFADASNRLSWKGVDGYVRSWNGTLTADRLYKLQNKSYTLADSADVAGLSSIYFPLLGGSITGTAGAGFVGYPTQSTAPGTPGSGFRLFADATGRFTWKGSNGYLRVFDGVANTADRTYTLQNASGTLPLLEAAQSWTATQTFSPGGTTGAGFQITTTQQFAISAPKMTDAQVAALTGNVSGGWAFSTTQNRPFVYGQSAWLGVMLGPQTGIGSGQIGYGTAAGNITSSAGLAFDGTAILQVGITGSGNLGQINFPSSQSGFFRFIQAPASTNTLLMGLDNSRIQFDNNGITLSTAQSNTQLRLEAGSHYGDFMRIRSYSIQASNGGLSGVGTISPAAIWHVNANYTSTTVNVSGGGYSLRVSSGFVAPASTVSATIPLASFTSFDGGGLSSGGGSLTFTDIATVRIVGAPTAGSGVTITNPYAFWVVAGKSLFGGNVQIGAGTGASTAAFEIISTTQGFLGPRAADGQIAAVSSPPVNLRMFSTNSERQNIRRTGAWYQEAFLQDVKRDTSYKVVNQNLDISGQTTNFKNRYHTVRISTAVTAAASGNNVITMPVPSVDLLGVQFKFYITDVSGDGDISQISFGTDGVDGYLSNGDATYQSTFNLFSGFDVDVSVNWDENKGAYRWFLR